MLMTEVRMFNRLLISSVFAVIAMVLLTSDLHAQYCIGATGYIIRDDKGMVMTADEIAKLSIVVNGYPLEWYRADSGAPAYRIEEVMTYDGVQRSATRHAGYAGNPMRFGIDPPAFCGKVDEVVLERSGKQMRLVFDIGEHNTYYEIDSLPFQPGTFQLKSRKCTDGKPPPMIDNNTKGKCFISADNWIRAEKK